MIDNKKVIDGQKEVIMHLLHMSEMCSEDDEPYYDKLRNYAINTWTLLENLLKKQEPKLVKNIDDTEVGIRSGFCPKCQELIYYTILHPAKFCKYCGQAVKWND